MIQTQRAYELNSKAIQTSDQMLQKLAPAVMPRDDEAIAGTLACAVIAAPLLAALQPAASS